MSKDEILAKFETLSKIPHCSFETKQMREFLADFARSHGCEVDIDEIGNIHAVKGEPKICLQSHYDMVCMGDAPNIKIRYDDDGFMRAHNSSLGADNGIGVAIMMQMLGEFKNIECLFTNDEEVGLIGANGFKGQLISKKLLNLDSEDDNEVIIGCAGGINVFAAMNVRDKHEAQGELYEVRVSGYPGGHSGNEIHKDIPNAIKILARFLRENSCKIVKFEGGERSNSIPSSASALVMSQKDLQSENEKIAIKKLGGKAEILADGDKILALVNSFSQGVRSFSKELNMPNDSVNLSIVKFDEDKVEAEFFARSVSFEGLKRMEFELSELAKALGFDVRVQDRSAPWKPVGGEFANDVLKELQKFRPNAVITAIHAGLECGVLLEKHKNLEAASIGPNIYSPHSVNERCEIASVDVITQVVRNIMTKNQ